MNMIKRFDTLDVATTDVAETAALYVRNFGFASATQETADAASIRIGDAQIKLRTGAVVAELLATSGEGLAAIWLEAEDLDQAATALMRTGVPFEPIRREGERRVLAVNLSAANQVPLFIFDRKQD
jgi:Glyoxalase/Bleomycin resistance protein/Dioxygenase superfamily